VKNLHAEDRSMPFLQNLERENSLTGVSETPKTCIGEAVGWNFGRDTSYPDGFHDFPQSIQSYSVIVGRLGQDSHCHPNPSKFIIHLSSYLSTLEAINTD
jgi:hypothetical protein